MAIRDLVPKFGRDRDSLLPLRRSEADPFRLFQQQLNRLFDDFFSDSMLSPWRENGGDAWNANMPKVDLHESGTEVKLSAELPGMDEKDVTVEMDDNSITIRGEKKEEKEERRGAWVQREQSYGSFHRMIALPAAVDSQQAKATFKKGVLKISAPKREPDKQERKRISITSD